jgi:nicotinate-nucleotide adenylyltransferase
MRIGVYGGAFDPPHTAHHTLAASAIDQLELDQLFVVPTGDAWHKTRTLTQAEHRLAMARLNFADLPQAVVDARETQRQGPSYTIDTLRELKNEHPAADFFLLMGADQAAQFESWKEWQQIGQMVHLVVAPRESAGASGLTSHEWHNHPKIRATLLHMPLETVSATDIRLRIGKGLNPEQALQPAVFQYIQQHKLYTDHHDRSL